MSFLQSKSVNEVFMRGKEQNEDCTLVLQIDVYFVVKSSLREKRILSNMRADLLSCQPRVTVTSCFVYKVIDISLVY